MYTIEVTYHTGGKRKIYGRSYIPELDGKMPLILCAHRYGETADIWEPYAIRLVETGYMVHAIDLGGACAASRSEGETWEMTVSTEVEDLLCALDSLLKDSRIDTNRIYLMGASQGGVVSALAAAQRTKNIAGLILLFPAFVIPYMVRSFFSRIEDIPERYDLWDVTLGKNYFLEAYNADYYKQIGAYTGKVLLLHGNKDQAVPHGFSKRALKYYPEAQLHIIEDADHGFEGEQFEEAITAIHTFLKTTRNP
ncbi:MAG: alpha/beta hydrolase [Bacteroidaceae bacterium]|nr:alpha/beta hydrolase [Bacteroidaceae bacterium]MBQ8007992.1 alpha/beta hydrolase [Bacteroidaceae bacterium]MBR1541680.1 alpha/beta hydrolase [Bacteroidaceae bacterium]